MALANHTLKARQRAEQLASTLPPLLIAADRVAATVAQGVHGRRRVGQGETFWQFRRYQTGDSARMSPDSATLRIRPGAAALDIRFRRPDGARDDASASPRDNRQHEV